MVSAYPMFAIMTAQQAHPRPHLAAAERDGHDSQEQHRERQLAQGVTVFKLRHVPGNPGACDVAVAQDMPASLAKAAW
jgi:hypothetical protein